MILTDTNTIFFSDQLQAEFAKFSGDWNPLHVDPVVARRTPAGRPVVHGIHAVLRSLETVAALSPGLSPPFKLSARFLKPVYVGDGVAISVADRTNADLRIQMRVNGTIAIDLHLTLSSFSRSTEVIHTFAVERAHVCRELSLNEMEGRSGAVSSAMTAEELVSSFPIAVSWLGVERVAAMLCLSRLVGMECPGRHSLFSGFAIEFCATSAQDVLRYQVATVDSRFGLLRIDVNGLGIDGTVDAFALHPPVAQVSIKELASVVKPNEFADQRALIVGGSRGLGELTAKLVAAGGGTSIVTYAVGEDDANRVAMEIKEWGGRCDVFKYNVLAPASRQLDSAQKAANYVYYYATSPIYRRRTTRFDNAIFEEFMQFYVNGFYDLCVALSASFGQGISAFYPSSVFVQERPREMTEYAMAKAAAEILCADLKRSWRGLHIEVVRLPRLLTDQTASVVPGDSANPVDVLLPVVRKVQSVRFPASC